MKQFFIPEAEIRTQAVPDGVTHFSTGVAILRTGKVLVVRRVEGGHLGGWYELPGGGVDDDETFEAAAIREAFEETGLEVTDVIGMVDGFDYQTPHKPKVRQINFVVSVEPGDVVLDPNEHDAYRWICKTDINQLKATDEIHRCLHDILARRVMV